MKLINNIKKKFQTWNREHNPYYYWYKVKDIFKRPKAHFIIAKDYWMYGFPASRKYYNLIIDISSSSLGWKTKYNSYRHEWDPYINIVFFRRFHLIWLFNWIDKNDKYSSTRNMATWEAILEYLYNNKSLDHVIKENVWKGEDHSGKYEITIKENLKCLN